MSAKKQIIIVCMVFILVAVGIIFLIGGRGGTSVEKSLEEAKAYYDMLDYDKAIAIYNNLLNNQKDCAEAYIGLADAYLVKGNTEKAIEILERGSLNSNDERIADKLAELSGSYENAEADEDIDSETETETVTDILDEFDPQEILPAENEITVTEIPEVSDTVPSETEPPETVPAETTTAVTVTTAPPVQTTAAPVVATRAPQTTTRAPQTTTSVTTTVKPTIEVPNFIGMDKNEASKLAKSLKINITFKYDENDTYANDVIYYQSNRAGTLVSEKDKVEAYVCVNNTKQVNEDDEKVQAFYQAAKAWGDADTGKIKSVSLDEKNSILSVSVSSIKRFTVDETVVSAFKDCKNAVLVVYSPSISISVSSSSVTKAGKIDLSADTYGNSSRVTLNMGASGSLGCTANVTIKDCEIAAEDIAKKSLYTSGKATGSFYLDSNSKPVITVTSGGQYVIR